MINNRILYLDFIKATLMYIVIWGHTIQYTNVIESINNPVASIIYSFHMPMFMALSGIWFHRALLVDFKTMLKKKAIQLLLPTTTIMLTLFMMVFIHKPRSFQDSVSWLWACRPWFVYTLFICMTVCRLFIDTLGRKWAGFLFSFLFFCLIPDISDKEIFMLPFFVLGYYWNLFKDRISKFENTILGISCISWIILYFTYFSGGGYDIYDSPYTFWTLQGYTLRDNITIALIRFLIGFFGTTTVFIVLKKLSLTLLGIKLCNMPIIQFIGRNTLGLYLLQIALFTIYMGVKNEILSTLTYGRDWLAFLLSFFVLAVLLLCIKIIKKSKMLKLLLLGESLK